MKLYKIVNTLLLAVCVLFTGSIVSAGDLTLEESQILQTWLTQPDKRAEAETAYWDMVTLDIRALKEILPIQIDETLVFTGASYDGDRVVTYSFTSSVPYPPLEELKAEMVAANCADEEGALLITIFRGALIFEHKLWQFPELPPTSYSITAADCGAGV